MSRASASPVSSPEPEPTATADNGVECEADGECSSGNCVDGVCCDSGCGGTCESCNSPGHEGQCTPYAYGIDPESECATPACYDDKHERFVCDGAGTCQVEITVCGMYACDDNDGCYTECRTDAECAGMASCDAGRCLEE